MAGGRFGRPSKGPIGPKTSKNETAPRVCSTLQELGECVGEGRGVSGRGRAGSRGRGGGCGRPARNSPKSSGFGPPRDRADHLSREGPRAGGVRLGVEGPTRPRGKGPVAGTRGPPVNSTGRRARGREARRAGRGAAGPLGPRRGAERSGAGRGARASATG